MRSDTERTGDTMYTNEFLYKFDGTEAKLRWQEVNKIIKESPQMHIVRTFSALGSQFISIKFDDLGTGKVKDYELV